MKTYRGTRINADETWHGDAVVTVDGQPLKDPKPEFGGFDWGRLGGGPLNLSFAILTECLDDEKRVEAVYRRFTELLVARLPIKGWTLTEQAVRAAAPQIERETSQANN